MENKPKRPSRTDNVYFGAFLGLIFPVIGFLLYYLFFFYPKMSLEAYWNHLFEQHVMSAALSLSLLLNFAVFFYQISNHHYKAARGIIAVTLFYGIFVFIFYFS